MKTSTINLVWGIFIIVVAAALYLYGKQQNPPVAQNGDTDKTVTYNCPDGRYITATFHLPSDQRVDVKLSDGRTYTLPHAISGSGARYANSDESIVFWNKGDGAFILEGGATTFDNCFISPN